MNTRSALSLGELSLALIVGVHAYRDSRLRSLPAVAEQTLALAAVLTDTAAAQIPSANLVVPAEPVPTRATVSAALEALAARASADHTLLFYFAGHAADFDGGFALLMADSDPDRLAETALTSRELERVLQVSPARGILLVLDCCGGAALAENAPGLFRSVGRAHDYRILLSAARAGQPSWEDGEGSRFTQALIEALSGKVALSTQPGALYFSDLYRHLHDRVAPDGGAPAPALVQQPIAAAAIVRDPLLFVNARLTLAQVQLRVQRYSQAQIRALQRRWFAAAAATLLLGIAGVWAYLAGHHYLVVENDNVALYRGVPQGRVLGYPHLVWQYDILREDIDVASPLAQGRARVSGWGEDFEGAVFHELTALGRARWHEVRGETDAARKLLQPLLQRPADTVVWPRAAQSWIALAGPGDQAALADMAAPPAGAVTSAALGRLFALAPDAGLAAARRIGYGLGTRGVHLQVLSGLEGACNPALATYLDEFAREAANGQFVRLSIDAALRTGCRLTDAQLGAAVKPAFWQDIARYLDRYDLPRAARQRQQFVAAFEAGLRGETDTLLFDAAVAYLEGAQPGSCPQLGTLTPPGGDEARLAAARVLRRQCAGLSAWLEATATGWQYRLQAAAPARVLLQVDLPPSPDFGAAWGLLQGLSTADAAGSLPALQRIAREWTQALSRRRAVRLLHAAGAQPPADLAVFESDDPGSPQRDAYLWLAAQQREAALDALLTRLSDPKADFVVRTLVDLAPTVPERARIVAAAQATTVAPQRRSLLWVLFGTPEQVLAALTQAEFAPRSWAQDGLGFRDDLAALTARLGANPDVDASVGMQLQPLLQQRERLQRELDGVDEEELRWRIGLMLTLRQISNTGLRLWLEQRCTECD